MAKDNMEVSLITFQDYINDNSLDVPWPIYDSFTITENSTRKIENVEQPVVENCPDTVR